MAWIGPQFSKAQVDKAGSMLSSDQISDGDLEIVNNWRSAHRFPLTILQQDLRKRASNIENGCIVVQRIKRLFSISEKLKQRPTMRLSTMQDIAGCRAVMSSVRQVRDLVANYIEGDFAHRLVREYDYLTNPKRTGYRSIHLIYQYAGRKQEYNDLKVEIQIRSANQHAWATAVETVGLFTHQALKSNKGHHEWLRFFASMATAIAYIEGGNPVPNTATYEDGLRQVLAEYMETLDVRNELISFGEALTNISKYQRSTDRYFLLLLDPSTKELDVMGYSKNQLRQAELDFLDIEKAAHGTEQNVVLVSARSTAEVQRAYPNYFLDTSVFLDLMDAAIML